MLIWMLIPARLGLCDHPRKTFTLVVASAGYWKFIYIGFFIQWYLSRYYGLFKRMNFWPMVRLLGGIGFAIIFGGLFYDWVKKKIKEKHG